MTGNTPTLLVGMAFVIAVLPLGLLVLSRAYTTIERAHPYDLVPVDATTRADRTAPTADSTTGSARADGIPGPRAAHATEDRSGAATST